MSTRGGDRRAKQTPPHTAGDAVTGWSGTGVDAYGGPVIDPTRNVLSLVDAAVRRQDDLADAERRRVNDVAVATDRLVEVRLDYERQLGAAESKRVDALALAESRRIDALRAIDAGSIQLAAAEARNVADVLRGLVSSAAAGANTQREQDLLRVNERFARLEQIQYEQRGQTTEKQESKQTTLATASIIAILISAVIGSIAAIVIHNLFQGLK